MTTLEGKPVSFTYVTEGAGTSLTRAEAVARLRNRQGCVTVTLYPGALSTQIRAHGLGSPEVQASGHGYMPATRAHRWGRLLIECAELVGEAERPAQAALTVADEATIADLGYGGVL